MFTAVEEPETLPADVTELQQWAKEQQRPALEEQAAWWLRSLSTSTAELQQLDEREEMEIGRIRAHYARLRSPIASHVGALERSLEALAELLIVDGAKKKSAAFTWGVIGRRTNPARVAVVDADAALSTIRTLLPSAVRVKESVDVKAATPAVMAAVADGLAVAGFELVPAHDVSYAKPTMAGGVL